MSIEVVDRQSGRVTLYEGKARVARRGETLVVTDADGQRHFFGVHNVDVHEITDSAPPKTFDGPEVDPSIHLDPATGIDPITGTN